MSRPESSSALWDKISHIDELAREMGLDCFEMRFELVPADILYTIGAYGMPVRFSHWTFGKAFQRLKTTYEYNLSRIYELVINHDPCYAFLLEGNTLTQNLLVAAHVYGHSDFFKRNWRFQRTSRKMLETMSASARRLRDYEFRYGQRRVEAFLDAVLAIQEHVDPYRRERAPSARDQSEPGASSPARARPRGHKWDVLFPPAPEPDPGQSDPPREPARPEGDVLLYIAHNARHLDDWQRDVISIVREEMLYFWPQLETKIMNEGWATFWHARIMRELDLTGDQALEFARIHSGVVHPSRGHLNPYFVGLKMWEDIERRFGLETAFEVRETETDISFIRNHLTEQLVTDLDLYIYKKIGLSWQIVEKDWKKVRDGIADNLVNGGHPYVVVEDGDYRRQGGLYLKHVFDGRQLDLRYLEKTLQHVYLLWTRPVFLETVVDRRTEVFGYDGERNSREVKHAG